MPSPEHELAQMFARSADEAAATLRSTTSSPMQIGGVVGQHLEDVRTYPQATLESRLGPGGDSRGVIDHLAGVADNVTSISGVAVALGPNRGGRTFGSWSSKGPCHAT
jgi:hypothetical protein